MKFAQITLVEIKRLLCFTAGVQHTESQINLGNELSTLGFKVVIPEIKYHDTRQALNNHFDQKVLQSYFWKTIFYTIDEENELMNTLNLKKEETILFGSSMGGFIASGIFFSNTSYAGLININGSSSFVFSEKDFCNKAGRSIEENYLATIEKYDPKFSGNVNNKPILFLHGEKDRVISIDGQIDFVASNNHDIQFLKYKDVNHTITNRMKTDLINRLDKSF
ncbi:S9 family peptidase [Bacillus sp. AFS017336]|uniref:alpha/beta hydrolase family protein n=1 Tax=Bacillus sp. AFS017336 TaxID=2033489 RepID=UPI000BEF997A|nr:dienelactone hydrolase family protein [Bacillus sp. AFS017336]PEL11223.1 phospholipase [Bacillus sp. AFS017336]